MNLTKTHSLHSWKFCLSSAQISGEAARKIGRKQQETVEVFLLRQFRSFLPSRQTNRQLCELLNSHLRIHKWPVQEVYTLMTRHRSVHHTLRTLRIIVRFKVEIISTFQMATKKNYWNFILPSDYHIFKIHVQIKLNIVKSVKIG